MNTTTLTDLIAALESAADGNVMLDQEVWSAMHPGMGLAGYPPKHTTSVDAALTLVKPEWIWDVGINADGNDASCVLWSRLDGKKRDCLAIEIASTPALAICAAALRARQEEVK